MHQQERRGEPWPARPARFHNHSLRRDHIQLRPIPQSVDFAAINRAALAVLPALLCRWLPGGCVEGAEYVVLNPRRADRRPGSFKVNIASGKWADFATGECGGDVVSLAAYLGGARQIEAARDLARVLGVT